MSLPTLKIKTLELLEEVQYLRDEALKNYNWSSVERYEEIENSLRDVLRLIEEEEG